MANPVQYLSTDQYNQVKKIMNDKGIPDWVWVPIMMSESGGNINSQALTSKEDSRGLFQINLKAHPQWKGQNLYDPVVNATLAADNFLSPALYQAGNQGLTNPQDITAYVWKNGIRPAWTADKNTAIRNKVATFLSGGAAALGLKSGSSGAQPGATTGAQDTVKAVTSTASDLVNGLIDRFKAFSWNLIPLLLGIILLILVLYKMFASGSETINIMMGGKKKSA
jgi:hypothetical protein